MADIQLIIEANVTSVNKAIDSINKLEREVKKSARAFAEGKIDQDKYNQSLLENTRSYSQFASSRQKASAHIRKLAKEELKAQQDLQKALNQKDWFVAQRKKVAMMKESERIAKRQALEEERAAQKVSKSVQQQERSLERLKLQYNETYSAASSFKRQLGDLNNLHRAGGLSTEQHTRKVEALKEEYRAYLNGSASGMNQFVQGQNLMTKGANRSGMAIQQTGYQVGDFLVQVQSGTNWMVAFGQQATQLVGVLPMVASNLGLTTAAAIGISTALGIGIPLVTAIGAAFMRSGGQAKSFKDNLGDVKSSLDEFVKLKGQQFGGFGELFDVEKEKLDRFSQTAKDLLAISKIETFKGIKDLAKSLADAHVEAGFLDKLMLRGDSKVTGGLLGLDVTLKSGRTEWTKTTKEVENFISAVSDINEKSNIDDMYEAALRSRDIFKSHVDVTKELTQEQHNFWKEITQTIQQLELLGAAQKTGNDPKLRQIQTDAMAMEAEIAEERRQEELKSARYALQQRQYVLRTIAQEEQKHHQQLLEQNAAKTAAALQAATLENAERLKLEEQRNVVALALQQHYLAEKASEEQKVATDTHEYMMALQEAYYATAKVRAAEVANETYLANYKAVMAYQGLGESLQKAPKVPVKAPKVPKAKGGKSQSQLDSERLDKYIKDLKNQADLESKLVGLYDEQRSLTEAMIKAKQDYGKIASSAQMSEIENTLLQIEADKARHKALEEAAQKQKDLQDFVSQSFEDGFMSMVDGTKSVTDAFRDMAREILKELYRVMVVKRLVSSITGFFGFADGGAFQGGSQIQAYANGGVFQGGSSIKAFANGGVVSGPTLFPMAGDKTGLMGEAGPEAIMPLKRASNGKLGVVASGGSGGSQPVNVYNTFNFAANGDDTVKKLIAEAAPTIAKAGAQLAQKQIVDSRQRGGSLRKVFG